MHYNLGGGRAERGQKKYFKYGKNVSILEKLDSSNVTAKTLQAITINTDRVSDNEGTVSQILSTEN